MVSSGYVNKNANNDVNDAPFGAPTFHPSPPPPLPQPPVESPPPFLSIFGLPVPPPVPHPACLSPCSAHRAFCV